MPDARCPMPESQISNLKSEITTTLATFLLERRATLAVAESLTGGHLQALITARSGCSAYFLGGITAYSLAQKIKFLGVDPALAARDHGVSAAIAAQMALGAVRLFGSDYAIATTGYAEPSPAENIPAPFAWYALAHRETILLTARIDCLGLTREAAQRHIAAAALAALCQHI